MFLMPDTRAHRGRHPEDAELFAPAARPRLQSAVADLSWLLSRGYAQPSAIKLVGDRYELNQRQRMAVVRSACTDEAREARAAKCVSGDAIAGTLLIDGFNVLTTIEVALAGGVILEARDGCYRDVASVHGTYRRVEETRPAILAIGETLAEFRPSECFWYFDKPVGNSGRVKAIVTEIARERNWNWRVELVQNPDAVLIASGDVVASADSVVLDGCARWMNLAREVIARKVRQAMVVLMSEAGREGEAPAEPESSGTESHGSAGASPSQGGIC
jgi:hypothetical protein